MRNATGKTGKARKAGKASRPFEAAAYLRTDEERAAYLEALLEDGDPRVLTLGLRDLAATAGGMAELARKTGLSRESLYRTLSARGNPRLDTLAVLLDALDLRLAVRAKPASGSRREEAVA